jgi:crotonobetainyl-CoA:carnitine CoA-transferase CaiB-like acyl-CoA transferase
MNAAAGILDGIRVIELADGIAGPVAGMLLAAAGADVVKVEAPGGAATRSTPGFATWNRAKRSVVVDATGPEGLAALGDLLAGADALIHGLSPAAAARCGLDDTTLAERFPALVVCAVTGYPAGHPDAEFPASDVLVLARSGLMDEQMPVGRSGPTYLRIPLASWGATYLAASGVLARLIARERTGRGGAAHTSLLQGALVPMTMHWARASDPTPAFAAGMPKDTAMFPAFTPSLFECADGLWLHVMGNPDAAPLMRAALAEMGDAAIAEADATGPQGNPNYPHFGANRVAFLRHARAVWLEDLWAADVAVQPCVPLGAVFDDEQAITNGYVIDVDDPGWGKVRQAGIPFVTTTAPAVVRPAPAVGAHTAEVLGERRGGPVLNAGAAPRRWPLEGLKVLDFGAYLAGPIAPMLMADLGADVIKIEHPVGDFMRFVERTFAGCQRGKRDIALDIKHPDARPVLEALVAEADVVHHNLRLPAARKLGIDYDTLRAIKPDLIYCHVSSYGPLGPRADWPGFDQLFQAASGWEYEGAGEGNPPMWHRFGMMDHQGGLASLIATLLAVYHRERTGQGQFVAASLLGASVLTISETMQLADGSLAPYDRLDHEQLGVSAGRRIVAVADGWVAVDATGAGQIEALGEVLGPPGTPVTRTVADVLAGLAARSVPATRVGLDRMDAFFDDPATWDAGLAAAYPHATLGRVEQVGSLWTLGDMEARLDRASPEVGQHSEEILAELGYSASAIATLVASGAVATARRA